MSNRSVPFFEYPRLWTDEKNQLIEIIEKTSSSGSFILQKDVFDFESNLSRYSNSPFSVGVGNATDGMEIILEAIGINNGDEIIICSHTMLATASAIVSAGGVPVPVEIGYDNLIDPSAIENAINSKTVGIMPTQLNGRTCKMDLIKAIAAKHGLFLIEDAAQALGSKFKGQHAGTFGLAGCISFYPAKVLGCLGDAGAVLVNDNDLFHKIYQIHDHGRDTDGEVKRWGRNSRLDNIQAAILNFKLSNYPDVIERRREIAQLYQDRLENLNELRLPPSPNHDLDHFDVYQNYELQATNRDKLKEYLSKNGIGTLIQWGGKAVHQFKELGFDVRLPVTENFFKDCIMIPMNYFISNDDVEYVCEKIQNFYRS